MKTFLSHILIFLALTVGAFAQPTATATAVPVMVNKTTGAVISPTTFSGGASLPSQTGHAGHYFGTNGTAASWNAFPTFNQNTTGSAATLTTPRNINGVAFNGSANITVFDATKAVALSVGSLSTNALSLTPKEWAIKTVTWSTNQVLTYTGGSNVAGDGVVILATVTSAITVTVTPTSATVYRNGSNSALGSAISVPIGTHRFVFWTPNTGSTVYLDDTVFTSSDVPVSATPSNYTPSSADVAGHLAGIDAKFATVGSGSVSDTAYDATSWDGVTTSAPSKNAVRDKIVAMDATIAGISGGTLFTTEMGVFWPTADIGSIPAGWLATGSNGIPSFTAIGSYSMIVKSGGNVAAPTFSPVAGTYGSAQSVTLSTATSGAAIRYTTNGTDPTRSSGTVYSTPVSVSSSQTLKAIAYKDYWADTAVQSAAYTISAAPTLSSATINTAGTNLTLAWSASVTNGAGGSGGVALTMSGGAVTPTYSSGSGSSSTVYSLSRTVNSGETGTTAYTQPGNGIEATTGGADVVTYSGSAVTNNSTQSSFTTAIDNFSGGNVNPIRNPMSDGVSTWTTTTLDGGASGVNQIFGGVATGVGSGDNFNKLVSPTLASKQYSEFTVYYQGGSEINGVCTNIQSGTSNCYIAYFNAYASEIVLAKRVSNVITTLHTYTVTAPSGGEKVRLRYNPSGTLLEVLINGSVQGTGISDATYSGGQPGIYTNGTVSRLATVQMGNW